MMDLKNWLEILVQEAISRKTDKGSAHGKSAGETKGIEHATQERFGNAAPVGGSQGGEGGD